MTLSEVWCERCDKPAVVEVRMADGSVKSLCLDHELDLQWKQGSQWSRKGE